jgi:hypothetical protein
MTTLFIVHVVILLALGLLSLTRYSRIIPEYRPMIIFILVIVAGDLIQSFTALQPVLGQAVVGVSHLLEVSVVAWQAKRWGMFDRKPKLFPVLLGGFLVCWLLEMVTGPLTSRISWCRILFSFTIVAMAIRMLTGILIARPDQLARNSAFLFSIGLMFSYAFLGMWESVMILVEDPSRELLEMMFYCSVVMLTITNLIYLKAIVCLPAKPKFSLY